MKHIKTILFLLLVSATICHGQSPLVQGSAAQYMQRKDAWQFDSSMSLPIWNDTPGTSYVAPLARRQARLFFNKRDSAVWYYTGLAWKKVGAPVDSSVFTTVSRLRDSLATYDLTRVLRNGNSTSLSAVFTPAANGIGLQMNGSSFGRILLKDISGYPTLQVCQFGIYFNGDVQLKGQTGEISGKVHRFAAEDGGAGGMRVHADANIGVERNAYLCTAIDGGEIPLLEMAVFNKALYNTSDGVIRQSSTTATELGFLSGVTSAVQTQIDGKAALSHTHAASDITSGTFGASLFAGTATNAYVLQIVSGVPTWQPISTGSTYTFNAPLSASGGVVDIADAAADGTTKGVATFNANDFDASSGVVSLDYTNAQKATFLTNGILTAADWTTFYGKANSGHTHSGADITSGTVAAAYLPATVVYNNQANTYTAGMKQTVAADATHAGFRFSGVTTDPSTIVNGDMWYNTTTDFLTYYGGSATKRSLVNTDQSQTLTNKSISGSTNTLTNIGNSSLTNSSITIAGNSTALGGTVTQDAITGLSGIGIIKRLSANSLTIAASGTDYAPATPAGTQILYGNGSGGFSSVTIGSGLTFSGGTLSASGGSTTTTDNMFTITSNVLTAKKAPQTLTYGTTTTWDISLGYNAKLTLTGNVTTFTFSNVQSGDFGTLEVIQDATGGRTITLPTSSKVVNGGGGTITLSTAASAIDLLTWYYNGSTYYWTYGKSYN